MYSCPHKHMLVCVDLLDTETARTKAFYLQPSVHGVSVGGAERPMLAQFPHLQDFRAAPDRLVLPSRCLGSKVRPKLRTWSHFLQGTMDIRVQSGRQGPVWT